MKQILSVACCLALATASLVAEQENQGKKKHAGKNQGAAQAAQPQTAKQGKGKGGGRHNINTNAGANAGQLNTRQGNKASRHAERQALKAQGANAGVQAARTGKIKTKHFDVAKAPNPKIETVKFKENNRIVEAEHWQGERYNAFRVYRSQWHDRAWWRAHHTRIVLIGGGWYFWNAGFWYPAWGYDRVQVYYPYDGPIYAYNNLPPDQVVANVQEALQQQGYYHGEVDGLLGPLTRAALADYQRDHGLYTTAAIDQPTMEALGFS